MNNKILNQGLVQIYTGNGKGKTTAAFGLAWRMLGYGAKVYICQFLKPSDIDTGEAEMACLLQKYSPGNIRLDRAEYNWNMAKSHNNQQRQEASAKINDALEKAKTILNGGEYDLVILDEIIVCYCMKLIDINTITELVNHKQHHTELIMTGRGADQQIIQIADLVTEMKEIKHPYNSGIPARKGIEF